MRTTERGRFLEFSPHEIEAMNLARDLDRAARGEAVMKMGCALGERAPGSQGKMARVHEVSS